MSKYWLPFFGFNTLASWDIKSIFFCGNSSLISSFTYLEIASQHAQQEQEKEDEIRIEPTNK